MIPYLFLSMDTACLRIKFTPLLQEAQKSSEKCCLEIVPEVKCIQNLDKLTWKQESNFIEYSIPMTYKIILRKQQIQDTCDEIVKTYHSCVDLLLSSSKSNFDLGSGDVSRIISDTFILSRIQESLPNKDGINLTIPNDKISKLIQNVLSTDDNKVEITQSIIEESEEIIKTEEIIQAEEVFNDDITNTDQQQCDTEITLNKIFCDKDTSTENISLMFTQEINTETPIDISRELDSKPKLSLSPICSINTQDVDNLSLPNTASKGIICKIYDSQKDLMPLDQTSSLSEIVNGYKITDIVSEINTFTGENSMKKLQFHHGDRSPPEIRIAQYVHYMEKEFLPLTVTLDEIISKCTVLGVYDVQRNVIKSNSNHLIFYKSVCMYKNKITTETREKSISNRAVYSIVFDG